MAFSSRKSGQSGANWAVSGPAKTFQVFSTRDTDELAARFSELFGRARVDLLRRDAKPHWRIKHASLGDTGIVHGYYESEFKISFSEFNTFAGSPAPLNGAGAHKIGDANITVSSGGTGAILSPGGAMLHYGAQFEHLSITTRPAALVGKLAAMVGDLRRGPLRFDPAVNSRNPHSKRLERLLQFIAAELDAPWSMPPLMQSELQQAMMTSFLLANANNYSDLLHGDHAAAAPWKVRIAEQFIEANWDQPITIEALVAATNVSARSLFSSFKTKRGYSPMDFVKRVRLGHARQKLSRPEANTSVSTVAFDCGFRNSGHFAADYRRQFGERPSETLRRGRDG
jgi:AraC-like DNA-binding protein